MNIDYSVIIRTTGKAGEKYARLLQSISKLIPQPKEVIVVLPEQYALPEHQLGYEVFCFSKKGMVIQRLFGIAQCHTPYALICDDDVSFSPDFVQKLHAPIAQGYCKLSAGPLFSFLPQNGVRALIDAVMGRAIPTIFHKDRYVSVLRSAGYSYNRHLRNDKTYYDTQSVAWTCFYGETDSMRNIGLEDEVWLDMHGYSAMDDQTMFYKAWLRNIKTIVVQDAIYEHLDAKTSTRNNKEPVLFSVPFNQVVFWHRFIYMQQSHQLGKIWAALCFGYRNVWMYLYGILNVLRRRMSKKDLSIQVAGTKAGWKYINSEEYWQLPPVR